MKRNRAIMTSRKPVRIIHSFVFIHRDQPPILRAVMIFGKICDPPRALMASAARFHQSTFPAEVRNRYITLSKRTCIPSRCVASNDATLTVSQ